MLYEFERQINARKNVLTPLSGTYEVCLSTLDVLGKEQKNKSGMFFLKRIGAPMIVVAMEWSEMSILMTSSSVWHWTWGKHRAR